VLRYIESNPLRAKIVKNSRDWEYSSLAVRNGADKEGLKISAGPVKLPDRWNRHVNVLPGRNVNVELEKCIKRGCPYGNIKWMETAAQTLGLETTLRPRGRPKKVPGTNGTVMCFSQLAHNVTNRTTVFLCIIER